MALLKSVYVHAVAVIVMLAASKAPVQSGVPTAAELLEAVQHKEVLTDQTGNIPSILALLLVGTPFADHVNINQPLKGSSLNLYLLAGDLKSRSRVPAAILRSRILGNCAFVGISNAIICDSNFIDSFLQEHGVFNQVSSDLFLQAKQDYQSAFLAWVLGHELGHIVNGDSGAHFGEANILESKQKAAIELAQKSEIAADLYAARQIERDKYLTHSLEGMLMALIDQEVAEKNGQSASYAVGLHWDYANKRVVQYFANQDHPEFVIRATRILTLVASDTHEVALTALLESFTRRLVQVAGDEP